METATISRQEIFLDRVNDLFIQIKDWLQEKNYAFQETKIKITEKSKKYTAPSIELTIPEKDFKVKIVPIGCYIIGAEGRVDIVGDIDRANLVYLEKGGPVVNIREYLGKTPMTPTEPRLLFKNIYNDGWYWIEDKRLGRAKPIDEDLFMDLINWVSDYEQ
jgi:hypothetical protein